jgi:hypothetical protein
MNPRIDAVRNGDVDQPVFSAEGDGRFRSLLREREQSRSDAAAKNQGQDLFAHTMDSHTLRAGPECSACFIALCKCMRPECMRQKKKNGTDGKYGTNGAVQSLAPFVPYFPSVPFFFFILTANLVA